MSGSDMVLPWHQSVHDADDPEQLIADAKAFLDDVREEDRTVVEGIFKGQLIDKPALWAGRHENANLQTIWREIMPPAGMISVIAIVGRCAKTNMSGLPLQHQALPLVADAPMPWQVPERSQHRMSLIRRLAPRCLG